MTTRRPPYEVKTVHANTVAATLRELAEKAEKGEIIGVVIAAMDRNHKPEYHSSGILTKSVHTAHWVVSLLQDLILENGRRI